MAMAKSAALAAPASPIAKVAAAHDDAHLWIFHEMAVQKIFKIAIIETIVENRTARAQAA